MPDKRLTLSQVEEIRKQAEKATKGPWELDEYFQCYIWAGSNMIADDGGDEEGTITRMRGVGANLPLKLNGEFMAASRTNVPALCELVKVLAEALDEAHGGDGQSEPETCKCGLYLDMCPKAALLRQLKGGELVKVLADALSIECGSHNVRATDSRDADVKPLCKCPRCALLRQLKGEAL